MTDSPFSAFVAFDVETTGLEPGTDKIIEIGAVRFENGKPAATFDRFVNPGIAIPEKITRLTGITDADCADAPYIRTVLPEFLSFIGNSPLVAHNLAFDRNFINEDMEDGYLENPMLDTLMLSRLFLPRVENHKLGTLAAHYGYTAQFHRAHEDAGVTGKIFCRLLEEMEKTDPAVRNTIAALLDKTDSDAKALFGEPVKGIADNLHPGTGFVEETQATPDRMYSDLPDRSLPADDVEEVFRDGGILSGALGNHEYRPEQVEMTRAVTRALNDGTFALIEAGTGTGKSIAYLVPSILWAVRNNCRVIISTNTKNLQEQLFFKDIPFLQQTLPGGFTAALLKGRGNYLCLNKWQSLLQEADFSLTVRERQNLLPLIVWAGQTTTGDISENNGFNRSRNYDVWAKVCAEANYCAGPRCRHYRRCFLMNARKKAQQSHLVIINHSLLFSDLVTDSSVLGPYDYLVMDEAHNIEKTALSYFGREFNIWRMRSLAHSLYEQDRTDVGLLVSLKHRLAHAEAVDGDRLAWENRVANVMDDVASYTRSLNDFFGSLTDRGRAWTAQRKSWGNRPDEKFRYRRDDGFLASLGELLPDHAEDMRILSGELERLYDWLHEMESDTFDGQEDLTEQLGGRIRDFQEILHTLEFLTGDEEPDTVYWTELPYRDDSIDTRLAAAPLNIADVLKEKLYDRLQTAVFTSATLTVTGSFAYISDRIGLSLVEPTRLETMTVGTSFKYADQALVAVPRYLPNPKADDYTGQVEELLAAVLRTVPRGSLVLFTSYRMLDRVAAYLKDALAESGITILAQRTDGTRTALVNRFREETRSVLLGTDSFWEGVDVPGEALEHLYIVRLPFAVPSEPIVQAQMEQLEKNGIDPFMNYTVPEAIIKFRQGFGRLIRSRTDRGAVIILDNRVVTTRYGRQFLESLPVSHRIAGTRNELVTMLKDWG